MKIIGLLIVLALGLFLTYQIAGDFMGFTEEGSSEMKFEPMRMGGEAAEKAREINEETQKKIEEATK